jgi:hypothetical protein
LIVEAGGTYSYHWVFKGQYGNEDEASDASGNRVVVGSNTVGDKDDRLVFEWVYVRRICKHKSKRASRKPNVESRVVS